jgi:D-alanyl-lipoteichoic acid acyltransferase DltB (MBOAT superfamily)
MLFNSIEFIFFFPAVVALYFMLPHRFRWVLLLIASYYFYMCWNYKYVVLIALTTTVNYLAGIGISTTNKRPLRILYLVIGLCVSLGVLFFFKYFNFFGETINLLFEKFNIMARVPAYDYLLPVGISFYTFQTLSYTIDVYFGKQKVEYHFGIFALYVSFFPQLVAGPIERSTNLLPQFYQKHTISYERVRDGIIFILWGFFKKVVIADRLSEYVNLVYNNASQYEGIHFLIATFFFSVQIYCDFSGYSDIAIGTAKIMGFDLMINFRRPYFSKSIREFWQRWHISLSTWFRDYVYIPLGGNRVSKGRYYFNLFFTFLVSGLWHGANWTFVIWGALHGFYSVFAVWTKTLKDKFNKFTGLTNLPRFYNGIQIITTFVLAYFAWIFFRANSVSDAFLIIKSFGSLNLKTNINLFQYPVDMPISIMLIIILFFIDILQERKMLNAPAFASYKPLKWAFLITLILFIIVLGIWKETDFLYFQF